MGTKRAERARTPADNVIEKCGGYQRVAEWLGITLPQVYKFTYALDKGGTGGVIPARHQPKLLEKSRETGGPLQPSDFFEIGEGADAERISA